MKVIILTIAILLSVTGIGGQPPRPRERDSNPLQAGLDHIIQKIPFKEIIALKMKLLPFLNKYLPTLNRIFGGENHQEVPRPEFPRGRPEFPRRRPEFPSRGPMDSSKTRNSTANF